MRGLSKGPSVTGTWWEIHRVKRTFRAVRQHVQLQDILLVFLRHDFPKYDSKD